MPKYDKADKKSILEHAKLLRNKSLRRVIDTDAIVADRRKNSGKGKGALGQRVERLHFDIDNNSESRPDLPDAGVEIKTSPMKRITKGVRAKERLSLNIIDYMSEYDRDFENSSFWKKNQLLLLLFYLHEVGVPNLDYVFKIVDYWEFGAVDRAIIEQDWEIIVEKIRNGKAHQLSEGDTLYLGACTKGSRGGSPRNQPFCSIKAKQRAYSLKQGYVNHIIASLKGELGEEYGKIIKSVTPLRRKSFEDIVIGRFVPFYGMTPSEIETELGKTVARSDSKGYFAAITKAILGVGTDQEIEEFAKAEITVRTTRVDPEGLPEESISFPYFDYRTLVNETWESSALRAELEKKFFFVIFQEQGERLVLSKVKFWNMPYGDMLEAKRVWRQTIKVVKNGDIVASVSDKGIRNTNFPKSTENCVAHVRPHARRASDTTPLPTRDKLTGVSDYTKHSFWLNDRYVKTAIVLS